MNTESLERVKEIIKSKITDEGGLIREHEDAVYGLKNKIYGLTYSLSEIEKEIEKDQDEALHTVGHAQTSPRGY